MSPVDHVLIPVQRLHGAAMTVPAEDLARLRRLAGEATPGPWHYDPEDSRFTVCIPTEDGDTCFRTLPPDAAYIAAFDPTVALSLLADLADREQKLLAANTALVDLDLVVTNVRGRSGIQVMHADAIRAARAELRAELGQVPLVDLSNHHNAALCPYCTPEYALAVLDRHTLAEPGRQP